MTNTASTIRATNIPTTALAAMAATEKEVESSVDPGNIVVVMNMTEFVVVSDLDVATAEVVMVSDLDVATAENIFTHVDNVQRGCYVRLMLDSIQPVQTNTYLLPLRSKEHA